METYHQYDARLQSLSQEELSQENVAGDLCHRMLLEFYQWSSNQNV